MKTLTRSLILIMTCFITSYVNAQDTTCVLNCNDLVNISLNSNCIDTITPLDVLVRQDTAADCSGFRVDIEYPYDKYPDLHPNVVDGRLRGEKVIYSVFDTLTGNSCWGYLLIEDKSPPQIDCTPDTIFCYQPIPDPEYDSLDCGFAVRFDEISVEWTPFECTADSMFLGVLERHIRVSDQWGNYNECTHLIYYQRLDIDTIECIEEKEFECLDVNLWDEDLVYFDEEGRAIPKPIVENGQNVGLVEPPFVIEGMDTIFLWPNQENCNIFTYYEDHVIQACGSSYKIRRFWTIKDWCDSSEQNCIQWIPIIDTTPPIPEYTEDFPEVRTITTQTHDCKAHLELQRPPIKEECTLKAGVDPDIALANLNVRYSFHYTDPYSEDEKEIHRSGFIEYGKTVLEYVPPTDLFEPIKVTFMITDECYNTDTFNQYIIVRDNDPPTPICDELTQVTLDPDSCWARVFAKDLDDGSFDNCADSLHFAVASMEDIAYWTNYWRDNLIDCHGHDYYYHHQRLLDSIIAEWIDFYVFDDFIDVTECDRDTLVLRVYEQFNFPPYDPHVFKGSRHYWYNWYRSRFLLPRSFRCNYLLFYEDILNHEKIYPPLSCKDLDDAYLTNLDQELRRGQSIVKNPFISEEVTTSGLHIFLGEFCYEDDEEKNTKINANLTNYPVLQSFVHQSQALRAFVFGDVLRHLFFRLPYYNDCMIEIIKDDKQAPICEAPDDFTIYCDSVPYGYEFEKYGYIEKLGSASKICDHRTPICNHDPDYLDGGLSPENDWERIVCPLWLELDKFDTQDGSRREINFGEATYSDNCTPKDELQVQIEDIGSLDECGTGYITRVWTIADQCGNTSECKQTIHVLPRSDYEVEFPEDLIIQCEVDSIDFSPEALGAVPIIRDNECEMIGTTYEDRIFDDAEEACYKIERTWKLVNWCAYSPDTDNHGYDVVIDSTYIASDRRACTYRYLKDGGDGYMEYLQIIKIMDDVKPEIVCGPPTLCSYDTSCTEGYVSGYLGMASDNCTDSSLIEYRYIMTPLNTGSVDNIYGKSNKIEGIFEFGTYMVTLIASDRCGNEDTCVYELDIIDCKKPTPYCYNGIATVIMPTTGEVTVWASDLDAGSFDNCPGELQFAFDSTGERTSRTFTCADILNGEEQVITVDVWVTDAAGNKDFCTTYIALQDGDGNACSDTAAASAQVLGSIFTEFGMMLSGVQVIIDNGSFQNTTLTTGTGVFMFSNIPTEFTGYRVKPLKNDDLRNGVSTLDLIGIQKHILGLQKLDSPYKIIAADINNSQSISALDVVALRKIILNIDQQMPNGNKSWRFVDAGFVFNDEENPWDFPEEIAVDLEQVNHQRNFVGIKIGDINETAGNTLNQAIVRSESQKLEMTITNRRVEKGEIVEIPVMVNNLSAIEGMQFELGFPDLQLLGIQSDILEENDHLWLRSDHQLAASITRPGGWVNIASMPFFILEVEAQKAGILSEMIQVQSGVITSEGYNIHGEQIPIDIQFQETRISPDPLMKMDQNRPNPFSSETSISINCPRDCDITFSILDVAGRVILQEGRFLIRGENRIEVSGDDLSEDGIYYYQIRSSDQILTGKMIKLTD